MKLDSKSVAAIADQVPPALTAAMALLTKQAPDAPSIAFTLINCNANDTLHCINHQADGNDFMPFTCKDVISTQ